MVLPKIVEDFADKICLFWTKLAALLAILLLSLFTFSPALFLLAMRDARQDDVMMHDAANEDMMCRCVTYTALIK